jgi:hypothetical protein
VLDELLAGIQGEQEIAGLGGLLSQLTEWLVERTMDAYDEQGAVRIDAPRNRAGTFEPQIVRKRQRCFEGFDEVVARIAAG